MLFFCVSVWASLQYLQVSTWCPSYVVFFGLIYVYVIVVLSDIVLSGCVVVYVSLPLVYISVKDFFRAGESSIKFKVV